MPSRSWAWAASLRRDASLGAFASLPIETVTIVFALLSGINYATHYLALVHRTPRPYGQDPELRWFLGVLAVTVVFLTVYLLEGGAYQDGALAFRHVAFHAARWRPRSAWRPTTTPCGRCSRRSGSCS